jgi:UDP-glucose 4-epimerase
MDLAAAHVAALGWLGQREEHSTKEVFNVGTGRGTSVLEAIQAFERATGRHLNYTIGSRRTGDVIKTYAAVDKATAELGWTAKLGIDEAMRDAHNWQLSLEKDPL